MNTVPRISLQSAQRTPTAAPAPTASTAPPAAEPKDGVTLGFTSIPSRAMDVAVAGPAADKQSIADQLVAHMRAYPSVRTTVAMLPTADGNTNLLVAGRADAVSQSAPDGVYGIIADLSGSPSIKDASHGGWKSFQTPAPLQGHDDVQEVRVPGRQTVASFAKALDEGEQPNRKDVLQRMLNDLPRGRRVALLLGGPSGAGKTSLTKDLQALTGDRKIVTLTGDMYFRDMDDPDYPLTPQGAYNWDAPNAMHLDDLASDISKLIGDGKADIPIYDFTATRPGGWHKPVHDATGMRLDKREHLELGQDDILVIDSLHATNDAVIDQLDKVGLPHVSVYLDSPHAEDRLLRRIVRDFAQREGSADRTLSYWDLTTFPGEVNFIRPTLLNLDAGRDVHYVTKFNTDLGLSRDQIDHKVHELDRYGLAPTYQAFGTPDDQLPTLAVAEEKRLQAIVDSPTATDAEKAGAQRGLDRLHHAGKVE